jgi:hypothetical protein
VACYTVTVRNLCKILVEKPGKCRRVWEKVSTKVIFELGKESRNRPGMAQRVPGGLDSQIS